MRVYVRRKKNSIENARSKITSQIVDAKNKCLIKIQSSRNNDSLKLRALNYVLLKIPSFAPYTIVTFFLQ